MTTNIDPESRRLPVYLLLDTSSSMMGPPIEAVKEGVKMLLNDLSREPWAQGMVWISIITFNSTAKQIIPLTEISGISEVDLKATGMTNLGQALTILADSIDKDVRKRTSEHRGDYRPVIYLLTDGRPTDNEWISAAKILHTKRFESFIACAAGSDADDTTLSKITETVIRLEDATPESLRAFIQWVSQSIVVKSKSTGLSQAVNEPDLPECADFVDTNNDSPVSPEGITSTL